MISNREWEAREDALILAEAERIRANPRKLTAAKGKARDGSIGGLNRVDRSRVLTVRLRKVAKIKKIEGENPYNVFKRI